MSKKPFTILGILIVLAITGYFIYTAFATSNPHTWTDGLVGYWSFDGQYTTSTIGTRDVSNNGNWGAFNGGVKPVGGISGQALSFDGVDDYIDAGNGASLNFGTGDFSIEAWIYPTGTAGSDYFITKDDGTATNQVALGVATATGLVGGWIGGASFNGTIDTRNAWHHIVVTRTSGAVKTYDNTVQDASFTGAGSVSHATRTLKIGCYVDSLGNLEQFFQGKIDEVRIYSRALSAGEVKQRYDQTRRNLQINQPSGTPPVGWWKMDEATGAKVRDYSVNGNNGTVSNGGYGATSTDGKIGKALSFDGVDDYVELPTIFSSKTAVNAGGFTWSAWVRTGSSAWGAIAGQQSGAADTYFDYGGIYVDSSGKARAVVYQPTAPADYKWAISTVSVNDNAWHFIAGRFDRANNVLKVYVDGVENGSVSTVGDIGDYTSHSTKALIGRTWKVGLEYYFNGTIDEVRIYNYARTADQIAADYRAGAYRTIIGTSVPSTWWTGGLMGLWTMNGQDITGSTLRDGSGNSRNGTIYGAVGSAGYVGQALSFDGVNDYVGVSFTGPNTTFSFETWVYRTGDGVGQPQILAQQDIAYGLYQNNSQKFGFGIWNGAPPNQVYIFSNAIIPLNAWTHVVALRGTDNNVKMYVNGVLQSDVKNFTQTVAYPTLQRIGGSPNASINWFQGKIDELRVYNVALSADEVMQHYQQTRRNLGI